MNSKRASIFWGSCLFLFGLLPSVGKGAEDSLGERPRCGEFLTTQLPSSEDRTQAFLAYVSHLVELRLLGEFDLTHWLEALRRGEKSNPFLESTAQSRTALWVHRQGLQDYLDHSALDWSRVLEWAESMALRLAQIRVSRSELRAETAVAAQKIEFFPIQGEDYVMGIGSQQVDVLLDHSIEVMSTPVTQRMWVELMGANPSYIEGHIPADEIWVQGRKVLLLSNHPVSRLTWWSALEFANRLSLQYGLRPAYDLSQVVFKKGTTPEEGTWASQDGNSASEKLRVFAPQGDVYLAEGFRLPTEAEQRFLLGSVAWDEVVGNLSEYAWFNQNSGQSVHPVGELLPFWIQGHPFFDLFGNVSEWGFDGFLGQMRGGRNPAVSEAGSGRVRSGGCAYDRVGVMAPWSRFYGLPDYGDHYTGFRLVRTLRSEGKRVIKRH